MKLYPSWYRARINVIEGLLHSMHKKQQEPLSAHDDGKLFIVLLRNGVIPNHDYYSDSYTLQYNEARVLEQKNPENFNKPLSFSELSRYNTWFEMHPEKVAGKEVITSSLAFPLTIEGTREEIIQTIRGSKVEDEEEMKTKKLRLAKAKAKAMKMKLDLLDDLSGWYNTFSGLDGLDAISELGELGDFTRKNISGSLATVRNLLEKEEKKKEYSSTDTLDFDEVVKLYNVGISEDEIKAWVWYKRSLGFPMKGWDKYYLQNIGESTDQIFATKETTIKDNHFRDLHKVNKGVLLGKPTKFRNEYAGTTYIVFTGTDGNKYYASDKDTEIKKASFRTDPGTLDEFVKNGVLFYLNGDLLPYPIYSLGNMYDRELSLQKDKEIIVEKYGENIYNLHRDAIDKGKPKLLTITNPDPKERPRILAISDFANNFLIKDLKIETGIELGSEPVSLVDGFKHWIRSLDANSFKEVTAYDIIHYYVEGHNLSKKLEDEEKEQIEKYGPIEGEELFSRYLYEALNFEDQQKIDFSWNREYNGQSSVQHHKIPVGFRCSAMFKRSVLEFTPAQREAIAFMEAVGSGIIAYDVGVGKTMSAIITLANAMYQGKCKSPLIVVPNPTYGKWIKEIIGYEDDKTKEFIPGVLSNVGIKVNEWYNLGTNIVKKIDLTKKIDPNTITIMTYEGFAKIGYSDKIMQLLFDHLATVLAQREDSDKTDRDLEKKFQTYREIMGTGLKNTIADVDVLGFDYLVIDEAHNFKNVFADVKAGKDGVKRFKMTGHESARAIKAFFLCNYVQRTYKQNVMLLTATPFTNSPLEIYSMLSHVGYESMKSMGIINIQRFMETFVQQTIEYVPNYKDEIAATPVVKSFNNRLVLQKIIYNHINYKTGEEAGVKRPCKINLPRLNAAGSDGTMRRLSSENQILTYLSMTPIQKANQVEIVHLARTAGPFDSGIIKALGQSLDNALSPFLYKFSQEPEDYLEFVEESPKIKYALGCVKSVKEYHEKNNQPVSGQIIYANRGKRYFPLIKEYLEKEIGYKQKVKFGKNTLDEVEIISSGMSQDNKELIKDAFLEGIVKIIIGTATIREGIDLQKKCTNIYNLYPDWNPTDIKQLEGRAWRQGNEYGYVRVTMPLVENSMDVFVFQKLDEKMHRINDIWFRGDRGNVMDVQSLDPEEVKFALFTNLDALAGLQLKREVSDVDRKITILESQIDILKRFDFKIRMFFDYQKKCKERLADLVQKFKQYFFGESKGYQENDWWTRKSKKEQEEFLERVKVSVEEAEVFMSNSDQDDKELLRLGRQLYRISDDIGARDSRENVFSEFKAYLSEVRKAEKTILEQKGYSINDNLQDIIQSFEKDKANVVLEKDRIHSEEHYAGILEEVKKKKEKLQIQGKTIEERILDFGRLNYLLDYKFSSIDPDSCSLPDPSRKLLPGIAQRDPMPNDRARKLRLAKAKALAMKMQLELLELD